MKAETDAAAVLIGVSQRAAHEVDAAAPPGGAENLGDGGLQPLMGVGDDELDAAQAPPRQLAQEFVPERSGFRGADVAAERLAPAVAVDADGDDDRGRDDAPAPTHLHVGGVQPDVGPVAFDGAAKEGSDLV